MKGFYLVIFLFLLLSNFSVFGQFGNACTTIDSSECHNSLPFPPVNFSIVKKYSSVQNTTIYHSPLVADVTGDCIPEILIPATTNYMNGTTSNTLIRLTSGVRVLNSSNGQTLFNIPTAMYAWTVASSFVVGDVNGDGNIELILAAADHTSNPSAQRARLICYDMSGNILWISNETYGQNVTYRYGGCPALADFNQDGIPEVYIYNEIFNAQTGVKLCGGGANGVGKQLEAPLFGTVSVSIAGYFDDNPNDLELAAGYSCYKVNIVNPNSSIGNSMIAMNMQVAGQLRDGYTSFGDVNQDGKLDIIVSTPANASQVGLFVYSINGTTANLLASTTLPTGGGGMPNEIGPAFVGDIDGSGVPSIGVTRPYRLLAYKYNGTTTLQQSWVINTNDISGQTGMTMFDFNQDGIQEIVYRDETTLRIMNGASNPPVNIASFPCFSGTGLEHPVVADIDNSGEAKICVPCGTSNTGLGSYQGTLDVFGASPSSDFWAPARGIWNQYQYHVLNVNDDLTIPQVQLNNATFVNGNLNTFYVQSSWLDNDGNYLWGTADISIEIFCVESLNNQYEVTFQVANENTASLATMQPFSVHFFNGPPNLASSNIIHTAPISNILQPGDVLNNLNFIIPNNNITSTTIYAVVNLNSNYTPGSPLGSNQYNIDECDFDNNVHAYTLPIIQSIHDTICQGQSVTHHGQTFASEDNHEINLQNQNGCDSLVFNLQLSIVQNLVYDTVFVDECNQYEWFGQTLVNSGQYQHMIQGTLCDDSMFVLNLTLDQPIIQNAVSGCDSIQFQNQWYYSNSLVSEIFTSSNPFCDSLIQTEIQLIFSTYDTLNVQSCSDYNFQGQLLTSTGVYDLVGQNSNGCSNYLHLNLTIVESYATTQSATVCGQLDWCNQTITQSGIYEYNFETQFGCDSLVTLHLTVNPTNAFTEYRYTCDPDDTMPEYFTYINSFGCDSTKTIQPIPYPMHLRPSAAFSVTPNPVDIESISALSIINLSSNALFYHWEIPNINFTSHQFTPEGYVFPNTGQYAIYLTVSDDNSCVDSISILLFIHEDILVYVPNTFTPDDDAYNNIFIPVFSGPLDVFNYSLLIFNRWGEVVFESHNPTVGWDGTYGGFLSVPDGTYVWKIIYQPYNRAEKKELTGHVNVLR